MSKHPKGPPPACISGSRLVGREGGGGGRGVETAEKNHLRLAFGCEEGGGSGKHVGITEQNREGGGGGGRAVPVVVIGFESPSLGWILPR